MKVFCILQIILATAFFLLTSCGYPETPMVKLKGPDDKVELVFFYKKGVSYEEKQGFENNILHKSDPNGKGYASQEGVSGEFFVRHSDYEGYAVEFYPNATSEQRNKLKKALESSPIVYKVFENVIPNQIQDL
jgi:hypothetical protein